MWWLRFAMIHSEPPITSTTMRTPNASAMTLLVLSGPVVMCRKNTRCTPICAIARAPPEYWAPRRGPCRQYKTKSLSAAPPAPAQPHRPAPPAQRRGLRPVRRRARCRAPGIDFPDSFPLDSSSGSHQIDHRKQRDPDDVERVPEQREAQDAPLDVGPKSLGEHLGHHGQKPKDAGRNVQAVAADQGKERRQEGAARRAVAAHHQRGEFLQLQPQERQPEQAGHGHRDVCLLYTSP